MSDKETAPEPVAKPLQGLDHGGIGSMTVQTILRDGTPKIAETRPAHSCQGCGERAGSISAGTGRPLVCDKASGRFFHLSCKPGAVSFGSGLMGLGA